MKTFFSSKWIRIAAGAILAVGVAAASLAFAPAAVQAQSGGPTPQPASPAASPAKLEKRNALLERAYVREQARLKIQTNRLDRAGTAENKLETLIAKARGNGKDVSALESALSAFRDQVEIAQTAHDQAAALLTTHSGFDANGKVTDATAARQTVDGAHKSLTDAGVAFQKATADLRSAVRTWRKANPPVKKTS